MLKGEYLYLLLVTPTKGVKLAGFELFEGAFEFEVFVLERCHVSLEFKVFIFEPESRFLRQPVNRVARKN